MSRVEEIEELPDLDGDRPPRLTREILGHDARFADFTQSRVQERLHHSWLLGGIKGIGKASFAYQAARHLLVGTPRNTPVQQPLPETEPTMRLIDSRAHPDLFVLARGYNRDTDKFRTDISVDDVRRMKSFFQLSSADGNWRVCIIDSLDEMNKYSLNSLLKILEEPPEKSIFFLISHRVGGLLDTIKSRSRLLDFKPLASSQLEQIIAHHFPKTEPEESAAAAFLADGSANMALNLAELGGLDLYRDLISLLESLPWPDIEALHGFSDRFGPRGDAKSFPVLYFLLSNWLHRALRSQIVGHNIMPVFAGEDEVAARFISRAGTDASLRLWGEINDGARQAEALNLDRKQIVLDWFSDMGDMLA